MNEGATTEVLYDVDENGVATITINRPKALNALNANVFERLLQIATDLRTKDSKVKCVILTSAGRSFSAGNDVAKGQSSSSYTHPNPRLPVDAIEALSAVPQPLLVVVNGLCYTGALELLLAGDITLASCENAVFCDTHSQLGIVPTWVSLTSHVPYLPSNVLYIGALGAASA
jgi:enoyl-CoA hydratase/carnithine racemase